MSLLRNILMVMVLLTIVWASLLSVMFIMAFTIFPALEQTSGPLLLSILRVGLGLLIFAAWVYAWYTLTKLWLYRVLLRLGHT